MLSEKHPIAMIYGAPAGLGGLGHCAASTITALATKDHELAAVGPGYCDTWPFPGGRPPARWLQSPETIPAWRTRFTWLRWRMGEATFLKDRALGRWAAGQIQQLGPSACYSFTQVGLESLQWGARENIFSVVENPNGHIRNFREVYERESARWCGTPFRGHPTKAMVDRVSEEYVRANQIRVYSEWAKRSLMQGGVAGDKIQTFRPSINLERFRPPLDRPSPSGPLRVCYAGSLDLRKGFVYLLRAMRILGANNLSLEIVGATTDRDCNRLFSRERRGLPVRSAAGDPLRAFQEAEIFVLPSLEDGFGLVVCEAMACGLPVIVTDQCGAAECVRDGVEGWVVPAGDEEALARALEKAIQLRHNLPEMGQKALAAVASSCGPAQLTRFADWFYAHSGCSSAVN